MKKFLDYLRDLGKSYVDDILIGDGPEKELQEDLSPRERKVCQMALDALAKRLKKEYRELLVKGGYVKTDKD